MQIKALYLSLGNLQGESGDLVLLKERALSP